MRYADAIKPERILFDDFITTCTPLARIDALEFYFEERVKNLSAKLLNYKPQNDDDEVQSLATFLKSDNQFLGVIFALANISQEKFLRILTAQRFADNDFGKEWTISQIRKRIKNDGAFALQIATLLIEGRSNEFLKKIVAPFHLNALSLPKEWHDIVTDPVLIENVIRRNLTGTYTDHKGDAIERIINDKLDDICYKYNLTHSKGQIELLGIMKEIDHVIPDTQDPYVFIMSSYQETTGSGQSARANEQDSIYSKIIEERRKTNRQRVLVNFVDGGGWLARRSDLRKIYNASDYLVNLNTLDALESIISWYVPKGK